MKLDRTLVTHVNEQTESEFLALLEFEREQGDSNLTVSTLMKRLVETYISDHRIQYQSLSKVFRENQ